MVDRTATGKIHNTILAGMVVSLWACTEPYDTKVDDGDDPLLVISKETTSLPIYDSAFVDLSWPQLAIDDFTRMEITRYYINVVDSVKNKTLIRRTLTDPKITAWQDTLYDDESVHYQLDVFTINGLVGSSEIDIMIPYTTRFQVLDGGSEFEDRARSILVDPGDTLQLGPGEHTVSALDLTRKPLFIQGLGSAKDVIVKWYALPPLSSGQSLIPYFLKVEDATIRNLTFSNGVAEEGGAIAAFGSTKIRNCIFVNNKAIVNVGGGAGEGGALYLSDNVEVSNCIIASDTAANYGGAIFIDLRATDVKILNTTIFGNIAYGDGSAIYTPYVHALFSIKNCIFAQNSANTIHPEVKYLAESDLNFDISYNIIDASWIDFDSTNISDTPVFIDPANGDFHLATGSPGINMGDPAPAYDDVDHTQNNIGAYGGPHGNW
jgi:hypothetical protein